MSKVWLELDFEGVRELLRSEEMEEICREEAEAIQSRCGDGYEVTTHVGKNRVNAMVSAESIKAKRSNLKHNTLLKAVKGK